MRITAAQALGQSGSKLDLSEILPRLVAQANWSSNNVFVSMAALNSLEALGPKVAPVASAIRALPDHGDAPDDRYQGYVPRLLEQLKARLP